MFINESKNLSSLQYIFCSDEYLIEINNKYLNHNYYTDIITFDLGSDELIEGEVYISLERVKENAQLISTSFIEELHRVIFHGALHLCGYKDKLKGEIKEMRAQEDRLLRLYFDNKLIRST